MHKNVNSLQFFQKSLYQHFYPQFVEISAGLKFKEIYYIFTKR